MANIGKISTKKREERFIKHWGRIFSGVKKYEGETYIEYNIRCFMIIKCLLKEYDKGVK